MSNDLVLVGGGEHARVVGEAVRAIGQFSLLGFVDPKPCETTSFHLGIPRLGDDEALSHYPSAHLILGMGEVGVARHRPDLIARLAQPAERWAIIIHPTAWVAKSAVLGPGTVVMAGALVQAAVKTGCHCVINTGAVVEHDVVLGDFAQASSGAVIGGGARIGAESYVGLGARVRDHFDIGTGCLVGMGATVTGHVGDRQTVLGTPARSRSFPPHST